MKTFERIFRKFERLVAILTVWGISYYKEDVPLLWDLMTLYAFAILIKWSVCLFRLIRELYYNTKPQKSEFDEEQTSYFHVKYSSVPNPTTSEQISDTPDLYRGTYIDQIEEDSADPLKYKWSRDIFQATK